MRESKPDSEHVRSIEIKAKLFTGHVLELHEQSYHLDLWLDNIDIESIRPKLNGMTWQDVVIKIEKV